MSKAKKDIVLKDILRAIRHSMEVAQIPGNDWRREVLLSFAAATVGLDFLDGYLTETDYNAAPAQDVPPPQSNSHPIDEEFDDDEEDEALESIEEHERYLDSLWRPESQITVNQEDYCLEELSFTEMMGRFIDLRATLKLDPKNKAKAQELADIAHWLDATFF